MTIKQFKTLPTPARKMAESVASEAKSKGLSDSRAAKVAWEIVKQNYNEPRVGKKSMVVAQSFDVNSDHVIDVLLGYPGIDTQAEMGGILLDPSGWAKKPMGVLKGDMEHYYADKAEGLYTDLDDKWEGFVPVAQTFWHDEEGGLHAKVELPEAHPETPTFIKDWKSGQYGVSIEYAGSEEALDYQWVNGQLTPVLKEWHQTGFTFTKNPSYIKTKK